MSQLPLAAYVGRTATGRFRFSESGQYVKITIANYPYDGTPPNNTSIKVQTWDGETFAGNSWYCHSADNGFLQNQASFATRWACESSSGIRFILTPTGVVRARTTSPYAEDFVPWD